MFEWCFMILMFVLGDVLHVFLMAHKFLTFDRI